MLLPPRETISYLSMEKKGYAEECRNLSLKKEGNLFSLSKLYIPEKIGGMMNGRHPSAYLSRKG